MMRVFDVYDKSAYEIYHCNIQKEKVKAFGRMFPQFRAEDMRELYGALLNAIIKEYNENGYSECVEKIKQTRIFKRRDEGKAPSLRYIVYSIFIEIEYRFKKQGHTNILVTSYVPHLVFENQWGQEMYITWDRPEIIEEVIPVNSESDVWLFGYNDRCREEVLRKKAEAENRERKHSEIQEASKENSAENRSVQQAAAPRAEATEAKRSEVTEQATAKAGEIINEANAQAAQTQNRAYEEAARIKSAALQEAEEIRRAAQADADALIAKARASAEEEARKAAEEIIKAAREKATAEAEKAEADRKKKAQAEIKKIVAEEREKVRQEYAREIEALDRRYAKAVSDAEKQHAEMVEKANSYQVKWIEAMETLTQAIAAEKSDMFRGLEEWRKSIYPKDLKPISDVYANLYKLLDNEKRISDAIAEMVTLKMLMAGNETAIDAIEGIIKKFTRLENSVRNYLKTFDRALDSLGLTVFYPEQGERFDPVFHKCDDGDEELKGRKIVKCKVPGIKKRDITGDDVLVLAEVEIDA